MSRSRSIPVSSEDYQLVLSALLNKGMAFSKKERDLFKLHGLIPPKIGTLSEQKKRAYQAFTSKTNALEKYIYLRDLQDSNETLFYRLLLDHLDELMPIVYTPTVGLGCQRFSHIYRRPRGLFISYPLRRYIDQMLANKRFKDVEVIVVSDGERILGLGDQGAGGMGIPIGKLSLYSACAGIHPRRTLPILLDVGTDNPQLINDPLYIGWQHERIRGDKYYHFIDHFVKAVKKRFPNILLQWEDFAKQNATFLLDRYQDQMCTFNDDIQGTASVVLASLLAAIKSSKLALEKHRFVIAGAGSAGCGIAKLILAIMAKRGIDEKKALDQFYLIDQEGVLNDQMTHILDFQKPFCRPKKQIKHLINKSLVEVCQHTKATVLIGVTGQAGIFTQEVVKAMTKNCSRPIIFPLSNPDSCAEATPENIYKWSNKKAFISTGSPFAPIETAKGAVRVDQTNNSYIFPGLGLGVISVKAKKVTQSMFIVAAETLASMSPTLKNDRANLLPPLVDSRKIAYKIAVAVAKEAMRCGVAKKMTPQELSQKIKRKIWDPVYRPYRKTSST